MIPFFYDSQWLRMVGGLITKASTSARAMFRLPHGAAPSTPVDGDVWTTTAGVYARINGATVGPIGSLAAASDVRTGTDATKSLTASALTGAAAYQILTDGASIAWNMASGFNAKVTIAGNRTLQTPTNPIEGVTYVLQVVQGTGGSRTMTWPASTIFDWGSAGSPTLSTSVGKIDVIVLQCLNATTPLFRASYNLAA
jgi:hypothetical protein